MCAPELRGSDMGTSRGISRGWKRWAVGVALCTALLRCGCQPKAQQGGRKGGSIFYSAAALGYGHEHSPAALCSVFDLLCVLILVSVHSIGTQRL